MPTILSINLDFVNSNVNGYFKKVLYKRNHCNTNIDKLKQRLSKVKWHELLDNINVNDDYDDLIHCMMNVFQ